MKKLLMATANRNKLLEARSYLGETLELIGLADLDEEYDVEETESTIEGNSKLKAEEAFKTFQLDCFAEDTGLEVSCLKDKPGVFTARFAKMNGSDLSNVDYLLKVMHNSSDRSARFKTVITSIINNRLEQFTGIVRGKISAKPSGDGGFGYDPVFIPEGYNETFAELDPAVKLSISHRSRALRKLVLHLKSV